MKKQYPVRLTDKQRNELTDVTRKGKAGARKINRARILLMADAGKKDRDIIEGLGMSASTVARTRQRFAEEGIERAMTDKPRSGRPPRLDGKQAAFLVALTCSDSPEDRETWTMQLLADRLVEVGIVESISDESVRRTLKKMNSSPGSKPAGAFQA